MSDKKQANLYLLYQYNLWHLINTYKLKYEWLDLSKEKFYNGVKGQSSSDWSPAYGNPWLNKYRPNKTGLAKEILADGMFTPIFYQRINDRKYVIIGKHRLYSLLFYNAIYPINKKFLFIELPNEENPIELKEQELIWFNEQGKTKKIIPKTLNEISFLLFDTGDFLTSWLWKYEIKPNPVFSDEILFEEWLKEDFNGNN